MKFIRSYLLEFNLVITTVPSQLTDFNLIEHIQNLNQETAGITDLKEIGDCRNLKDVSKLTVKGTISAASYENDRSDSLLALIIPDDKLLFGFARAYQTFAEDHRKNVSIFNDIQKALEWLDLCEEAKIKAIKMLNA